MAFNGSGTFVRVHSWTTDLSNTVPVTASRMDAEDDGIATGLSLTICRDGQSTTTARIPFAAGVSAAAGATTGVSYAQTNDTNTGMYFPAADQVGLVAGGTEIVTITSSGISITGTLTPSGQIVAIAGTVGAPGISFASDLDCGLYRIGANNIGAAVNGAKVLDIGTAGLGVTGTLTASGAATLSSSLAVTGVSNLTGAVTTTGALTVGTNAAVGGTINVVGNTTVNTDKFVVAAASGNTTVGGTLAVTGTSTFTGAAVFNGGAKIPLLHVREQQVANTDGGTFTSGAWRTRTLTTEVTNEITGASLASNQITLPAGTYEIDALAPAVSVGAHKAKLCNITDTADTIVGQSMQNDAATGLHGSLAVVRGRFTIAAQKVFELQHRCATSRSTTGLGSASNLGVIEVYSDVMIRKIA